MKKKYAQHNERVCEILEKDGSAHDWVVTTAFYSALHFVQHEIFPLTNGTNSYNSFDSYYHGHYSSKANKPSKHQATIDLVTSELGATCGSHYQRLHDTCRKARYHKFDVGNIVANSRNKI